MCQRESVIWSFGYPDHNNWPISDIDFYNKMDKAELRKFHVFIKSHYLNPNNDLEWKDKLDDAFMGEIDVFDINDIFDIWVMDTIQNNNIYKHGDIVWFRRRGFSTEAYKEYGINLLWVNNDGTKELLWQEGMPPVDLDDFNNKVNFTDVCKSMNEYCGYDKNFHNAWYKWWNGIL